MAGLKRGVAARNALVVTSEIDSVTLIVNRKRPVTAREVKAFARLADRLLPKRKRR